MPNQTLTGSLLLHTEPSSANTSLSVSRTDIGTTTALAQISMYQGVLAFSAMNGGGVLEEKMRIHTNGNVGIGTKTPSDKLDVYGTMRLYGKNAFQGHDDYLRINQDNAFPKGTHFSHRANFYSGLTTGNWWDVEPGVGNLLVQGNVGIGTITPSVRLDVNGTIRAGNYQAGAGNINAFSLEIGGPTPKQDSGQATIYLHHHGKVAHQLRYSEGTLSLEGTKNGYGTSESPNFFVGGTIGTNGFSPNPLKAGWGGGIHTWDVEAEGTMWSRHGYQSGPRDLAENYLSKMKLEPGDVVCLDKEEDLIVRSEKADDTTVLGIVSTKPGFLLNVDYVENGELFPVALCGRVPCRVTDENGPIIRGDLLTSSSTPGHAMKAKPIEVNGIKLYKPGTIIGKALDPLKTGKGLIDVFVFSS